MPKTPAEQASREALERVFACLEAKHSFRLEAGAGAGKTYSLVKALEYLIEQYRFSLPRRNQQIACITFTNVAKNEIETRTDKNPIIYCNTNHAFCWNLISGFQKQLRELVSEIPAWQELLEPVGGIGDRSVEYNLGHRSVGEDRVLLHHDDVLPLTISLMNNSKFQTLTTQRFPIILIDEYQDTDANWVDAIKEHFLGRSGMPLFGFFGDHWQKIYGNGCGSIEHPAVEEIGKRANFRSVKAIVDCLNRMRPELPQFVEDETAPGEVKVIHSNAWTGTRQSGPHWGGDLEPEVAHALLGRIKTELESSGWDFSPEKTKILMLTHRLMAIEQGYSSLPAIFRFNESFAKKEHPLIAFFVDTLEPACAAFGERRYGAMFSALGGSAPLLRKQADKERWTRAMTSLLELRENRTVGEVVDRLRKTKMPRLPDTVDKKDLEVTSYVAPEGEEIPRSISEWKKLREVSYSEIKALTKYLAGFSPFETKHGVKGAEFENVLVVFGRGWNQYNFGEMLELAGSPTIPSNKRTMYERNRNLFYVTCSRPKKRLALLFTQKLSTGAISTLNRWFGPSTVRAAQF
jgi:DNA helicase-2/ATP-dependent DNA helicase PcrA